MILIAGASGAGKSTVAKELEAMNYSIIPTYTTRKPRPNDDGTICISDSEFERMLVSNSFMSYHVFGSMMGKVAYGIPIEEYQHNPNKSVIVLAKEYLDDIKHYVANYAEDEIFLVYIDVNDDTIIRTSIGDSGRGLSNTDLQARLVRDRDKNESLKKLANLVIENNDFRLLPYEVAAIISSFYEEFIEDSFDNKWQHQIRISDNKKEEI